MMLMALCLTTTSSHHQAISIFSSQQYKNQIIILTLINTLHHLFCLQKIKKTNKLHILIQSPVMNPQYAIGGNNFTLEKKQREWESFPTLNILGDFPFSSHGATWPWLVQALHELSVGLEYRRFCHDTKSNARGKEKDRNPLPICQCMVGPLNQAFKVAKLVEVRQRGGRSAAFLQCSGGQQAEHPFHSASQVNC